MKFLRLLSLSLLLPAIQALPALANPTVTSPYNGSTVTSPFTLTANASTCSSQAVSSMGYSLDAGTSTITENGTALQKSVSAGDGGHTIHVKSWGNKGAVCVTDVAITVSSSGSSSGSPSVSSPTNGATVSSPFNLAATASSCAGQPVSSIGYSMDDGTYTATVSGTTLNAPVTSGTGGHTLHAKSWGNGGAACQTNVAVTVSATTAGVPSNATNLSNLQASGTWSAAHDPGTPGWSSGWSGLTGSPSRTGNARHLSTTYANYGGERYEMSFSDDINAHNFVYDGWIYIKDTAAGIANIEMDLNQVIANGWTVIMGFQCDGWNGTWDFTTNKGSPTSPNDQWIHTGLYCNPKSWGVNAWHHLQISFYRDDSGFVTYQWVALDGAKRTLNVKTFSGFALGWGKTVLTNFQIDGATSAQYGSNVFLDDLTVSRW